MEFEEPLNRRTRREFLGAVLTGTVAGIGGCLGDDTKGDPAAETVSASERAAWLDDANGYNGVADRTGRETVRVAVGPESATLAFVPTAVRIDPGTTIRWEWGPDDTEHNVVGVDTEFESELTATADHAFSREFDEPGTVRYHCRPHRGLDMVGAIIVDGE
ncbi:halocyanin domain-containing protein [Halorubrum sp. F4]|uniref:halocyanin domain-containing protein n=1 Tax=Halorubrum sp. F4 TaxID=2989715 RepID=UPI002480CBDA|nr:halocyanin domain-containing protein [Halorubrum sp. F4]